MGLQHEEIINIKIQFCILLLLLFSFVIDHKEWIIKAKKYQHNKINHHLRPKEWADNGIATRKVLRK